MNNQRFSTVLFDIDGVMLSEERYFDGSALTVYELLCSPQYVRMPHAELSTFRTTFSDEEIAHIRAVTFANDSVFETVKKRGINANWDMVYLQVAFHVAEALKHLSASGHAASISRVLALASNEGWTRQVLALLGQELQANERPYSPAFESFNGSLQGCATKADLFDALERMLAEAGGDGVTPFATQRALWMVCQETFQEWYLGDEYVSSTHAPGKSGFLSDEVPIVDPTALKQLFRDIKATGATIGIATGRPELETTIPLQYFGWLEEFEIERISTASDVLAAEKARPSAAPLAKPNPYSYHRSYLAESEPGKVLDSQLPIAEDRGRATLVVGDSVADLLAARALGCQFAAVLTGLEGERARSQFEDRHADYILDDVMGLRSILGL